MRNMEKQIKHTEKKTEIKGRYPFKFLMEVRDLASPITIKRIQILKAVAVIAAVGVSAFFAWQKFVKAPDGQQLVAQMVDASGGLETWQSLERGQFTRTHQLFSNTGELISERTETFYFGKDENNSLKYMLDIDAPQFENVTIAKDGGGFWASQEQSPVDPVETAKELGLMCDSKWCSPDCNMSMAFFRFSMPFKLMDNGVIPENGGKSNMDNAEFQVVNISYNPEVGRDKWVFHTNPETNLIHKMEYHHYNDDGVNKPEELYWSDYREVAGLQISHKWTRYWSNGQILEQYTFSNFDFESELPKAFFERPSYIASN